MANATRTAKLHRLTAREVLNAAEGTYSDGGGLMLCVRGESASWVLRYTSPTGRRREMGLGATARANVKQAGESMTEARDAAERARKLLREGADPITDRANRREASREHERARKSERERERWTLARCAREYHERVVEPVKTAKHAAQWIASLENHMPAAVWNKPIGDVTAPELLAALLAIKPHERARNRGGDKLPETVRRIRQRLDSIYQDAIFHGRCAVNVAAAVRRKLSEGMPKGKAGSFAALAPGEAPALMARLRQMQGTAARCLELAMLTAARTNEVLSAEWQEFDMHAAVWTVPAAKMKAREVHTVFLSEQAVALLKARHAIRGTAKLVFPSPTDDRKPLSNMAMLAVLDRLGYREQTTVHGLCRATFSTWANENDAARPDVIEACLAHRESDKVRAAYNRAKFNDERRALLAAWAAFLDRPAGKVLRFATA